MAWLFDMLMSDVLKSASVIGRLGLDESRWDVTVVALLVQLLVAIVASSLSLCWVLVEKGGVGL